MSKALSRCLNIFVLFSYLNLLIAPAYAERSYQDADIRFEVEKDECFGLNLKVYDRGNLLFDNLLSIPPSKDNIHVKQKEDGYKVKYQASTTSALSLHITEEGNVSLLKKKGDADIGQKKVWGIKTFGQVINDRDLSFYGLYTYSKQLLNSGSLLLHDFHFSYHHLFNTGIIRIAKSHKGFNVADIKARISAFNTGAQAIYQSGYADNYGYLFSELGFRNSTGHIRNYGLLDTESLSFKENGSLTAHQPVTIHKGVDGEAGVIHNNSYMQVGSFAKTLKAKEVHNNAVMVIAEKTDLSQQFPFKNTGMVIADKGFTAHGENDSAPYAFKGSNPLFNSKLREVFQNDRVTATLKTIQADQHSQNFYRLIKTDLAVKAVAGWLQKGVPLKEVYDRLDNERFQSLIEKIAVFQALNPSQRETLLSENFPEDIIILSYLKGALTLDASLVHWLTARPDIYLNKVNKLFDPSKLARINPALQREQMLKQGIKLDEIKWPESTVKPIPADFKAAELVMKYFDNRCQLWLQGVSAQQNPILLKEQPFNPAQNQEFFEFFQYRNLPTLIRYTAAASDKLLLSLITTPFAFAVLAETSKPLTVNMGSEGKDQSLIMVLGSRLLVKAAILDAPNTSIRVENGSFTADTAQQFTLGRPHKQRVQTKFTSIGVEYNYPFDYQVPNGTELIVGGLTHIKSAHWFNWYGFVKAKNGLKLEKPDNGRVIKVTNRGRVEVDGADAEFIQVSPFDMQRDINVPKFRLFNPAVQMYVTGAEAGAVPQGETPRLLIQKALKGTCSEINYNTGDTRTGPDNLYVGGGYRLTRLNGQSQCPQTFFPVRIFSEFAANLERRRELGKKDTVSCSSWASVFSKPGDMGNSFAELNARCNQSMFNYEQHGHFIPGLRPTQVDQGAQIGMLMYAASAALQEFYRQQDILMKKRRLGDAVETAMGMAGGVLIGGVFLAKKAGDEIKKSVDKWQKNRSSATSGAMPPEGPEDDKNDNRNTSYETRNLAEEVAKRTGGQNTPARGEGYTIRIPNGNRDIVVRIMERAGQRTEPYYRISVEGKSAVTSTGEFSTNPSLTHQPINPNSLKNIVEVISKIKG